MQSIRGRLTSGYALALVPTLMIFVFALLYARKKDEEHLVDARVAQELDRTIGILEQELRGRTPAVVTVDTFAGADSLLKAARARADSVAAANEAFGRIIDQLDLAPAYILLADASGRVLYRSLNVRTLAGNDTSRIGVPTSDSAKFALATRGLEKGSYRLFAISRGLVLLRTRDVRIGSIHKVWVGLDANEANLAPGSVIPVMLIAGPLLIALSVAVAYGTSARAFEPVNVMIDQVEAITDGRSLHRRLAVGESADELSRLSATLNAMIERLETSFGALRRFTADASHELKTPLTVIRADVERSMSPHSTRAEKEIAMEEALQQVTRMADLVNSLLILARADEGRLDLHREPVQVLDLAREIVETARLLGEGAGLTIDVPVLEAAEVQGDATRLRQLFMNLVENAIKYSSEGGRVEITLARAEGEVQFAVRDNGIGIAAADLPFIFERFWRADRARSRASERGGNGLGLAICQWIAHAHGGSLTVESRLGRGSRFVAHLPLSSEAA